MVWYFVGDGIKWLGRKEMNGIVTNNLFIINFENVYLYKWLERKEINGGVINNLFKICFNILVLCSRFGFFWMARNGWVGKEITGKSWKGNGSWYFPPPLVRGR